MGDRVSIQFESTSQFDDTSISRSVCLFSHWGGMEFVRKAVQYTYELTLERESRKNKNQTAPIDRYEANTVMVDFIRYLTKNSSRVESDFYLASNEDEGDSSDNGHHIIHLPNMAAMFEVAKNCENKTINNNTTAAPDLIEALEWLVIMSTIIRRHLPDTSETEVFINAIDKARAALIKINAIDKARAALIKSSTY